MGTSTVLESTGNAIELQTRSEEDGHSNLVWTAEEEAKLVRRDALCNTQTEELSLYLTNGKDRLHSHAAPDTRILCAPTRSRQYVRPNQRYGGCDNELINDSGYALNDDFLIDVGISQNHFNVGQQLLSVGIILLEVGWLLSSLLTPDSLTRTDSEQLGPFQDWSSSLAQLSDLRLVSLVYRSILTPINDLPGVLWQHSRLSRTVLAHSYPPDFFLGTLGRVELS